MKIRYIVYSILVSALLNLSQAHASDSASMHLVGIVQEIANIEIQPNMGAISNLDLRGGETARNIGVATERFNGVSGYQITLESSNSGQLRHQTGAAQVDYSISYNGGAATKPGPIGSGKVVKTIKSPTALSGANGSSSSIEINIPKAVTNIPGGAYTDTVVFTISSL